LAGAPGFEPGNAGIKIRCLTTWLRPKPASAPRIAARSGHSNERRRAHRSTAKLHFAVAAATLAPGARVRNPVGNVDVPNLGAVLRGVSSRTGRELADVGESLRFLRDKPMRTVEPEARSMTTQSGPSYSRLKGFGAVFGIDTSTLPITPSPGFPDSSLF
jgi:hypothetical protein